MKIRNYRSAYSMVTKYRRKNGKVYSYSKDQIDAINNGTDINTLEPTLYKKPSSKNVDYSPSLDLINATEQAILDYQDTSDADDLVTAYNSNYVIGFNSFV